MRIILVPPILMSHTCVYVHSQFDTSSSFKIPYFNYRHHLKIWYSTACSTYKNPSRIIEHPTTLYIFRHGATLSIFQHHPQLFVPASIFKVNYDLHTLSLSASCFSIWRTLRLKKLQLIQGNQLQGGLAGFFKLNSIKLGSTPKQSQKKAADTHVQNLRMTSRAYQKNKKRNTSASSNSNKEQYYPKKGRIKTRPRPGIQRMTATARVTAKAKTRRAKTTKTPKHNEDLPSNEPLVGCIIISRHPQCWVEEEVQGS